MVFVRGGRLCQLILIAGDIPDQAVNFILQAIQVLVQAGQVADLVKLHCFAGLPLAGIAGILGVSTRTAERYWAFAKTWLYREVSGGEPSSPA